MMNQLRSKVAPLTAAVFALPLGGFASAAQATPPQTYYVSPTGSDSNSGTVASRFKTIQKCANLMEPGDTCEIETGDYAETVTPAHSGTAASPITYTAAPGAQVTIDGASVVNGWSQVT